MSSKASVERSDEFSEYLNDQKSVTIYVQYRKNVLKKSKEYTIAAIKRQHEEEQASIYKISPSRTRTCAEVINAKLNRGVDSVSPGNVVLYKCFNEIASRITAVSNLQVVEQPQRSSIVNSTSMSGQPEYQEQPLNNRMHHEVGETPRPSTSRNSEDHFNTHQAVSSGSNLGILHGGGVRQREGFSYITVMTETDRFIRRFNMTAKTVIFSFKPVDADNPFEWLKIEGDTINYVQYNIMKQERVKVCLRLKKGVSPHIFLCQKGNVPPTVQRIGAIKRQRLSLVKEALSGSTAKNDVLKPSKQPETIL
ncbi:hypothetical protein RN001_009591 [Aquatica leii]|uniref:Uncharacterized protein n=1 Tax=Aquatica leii TaxID=1421715 RepID=A0AAN7Q2K9_9COLE|nr:hypothetical protein RN001_009591 [Aquatica leii]